MRKITWNLAAGAAALALVGAAPAWAAHTTAVFTGLASIHDVSGVMGGAPDTTLSTTFEMTFFIDDATPGSTIIHNPDFPYLAYLGVQGDGDGNPIRGDVGFGNGYGFSAGYNYGPPSGGAYGDAIFAIIDPTAGLGPGGAFDYSVGTYIFEPDFQLRFNMNVSFFSPSNFGLGNVADYNQPFTYVFGPDDQMMAGGGEYFIGSTTPQAIPQQLTFTVTPLTLLVTTDRISAAPEPTSWALMILGFGGVGAALRRRRVAFA